MPLATRIIQRNPRSRASLFGDAPIGGLLRTPSAMTPAARLGASGRPRGSVRLGSLAPEAPPLLARTLRPAAAPRRSARGSVWTPGRLVPYPPPLPAPRPVASPRRPARGQARMGALLGPAVAPPGGLTLPILRPVAWLARAPGRRRIWSPAALLIGGFTPPPPPPAATWLWVDPDAATLILAPGTVPTPARGPIVLAQGSAADVPLQCWNRGSQTTPVFGSEDETQALIYGYGVAAPIASPAVAWYTAPDADGNATQTGYGQGQIVVSVTNADAALLNWTGGGGARGTGASAYTLIVKLSQAVVPGKTLTIVRLPIVVDRNY